MILERTSDPCYLLTRWEQVTVFRLRTGHNCLSYYPYSKLCISHAQQCPCGTGSQTTDHLLQSCPLYKPLGRGIWPDHTLIAGKLYSSLEDLMPSWSSSRRLEFPSGKHEEWKHMFKIGLCLDTYELISFKLGIMRNMTKLYIFIPPWMILTFTLGHIFMRKLVLVQSFCCKVAWSSLNICSCWSCKWNYYVWWIWIVWAIALLVYIPEPKQNVEL